MEETGANNAAGSCASTSTCALVPDQSRWPDTRDTRSAPMFQGSGVFKVAAPSRPRFARIAAFDRILRASPAPAQLRGSLRTRSGVLLSQSRKPKVAATSPAPQSPSGPRPVPVPIRSPRAFAETGFEGLSGSRAVVAKPIPPKICTAGRVVRAVPLAVTGIAITIIRPILARPPEWAKPKKAVKVITVTETTKVAPAVEAMIAVEAMTHAEAAIAAMVHGERTAAEAATEPRSPPWFMANGRPPKPRHRSRRHGA